MDSPVQPSVVLPVSPAFDRMRRMLFRPFDFSKWLAIGFCSWLAGLAGTGGSGGGNYNIHNTRQQLDLGHDIVRLKLYLLEHLIWAIPVVVFAILLILGLVLLLLWLSSRGAFMFLHCVVHDQSEVAAPWREYRREGNSLFLFRLILTGCGLILFLFFVALFAFLALGEFGWVIAAGHAPKFSPLITGLVIGAAVFLLVWLTLMITLTFTKHFVVPIMYLRRCTCTEAWGEFLCLLRDYPGSFVLYILFQIVISIVVALIVLAAILCTCCIGLILLLLPVVGAVLLLPITVFWRNYSLLYLAQFGSEYGILREILPALPQ